MANTIKSLESQAYQVAFERVKSWSSATLLTVWKCANSKDACPEHGWGTYINNSWVVITWDEWCEILYSEISTRELSAI